MQGSTKSEKIVPLTQKRVADCPVALLSHITPAQSNTVCRGDFTRDYCVGLTSHFNLKGYWKIFSSPSHTKNIPLKGQIQNTNTNTKGSSARCQVPLFQAPACTPHQSGSCREGIPRAASPCGVWASCCTTSWSATSPSKRTTRSSKAFQTGPTRLPSPLHLRI